MESWKETFVVEEDDGPPVGICIDLPDGTQIWTGEASRALLADQSEGVQDELNRDGSFVIRAAPSGSPEVLAQIPDFETGVEIARALAAAHSAAPALS